MPHSKPHKIIELIETAIQIAVELRDAPLKATEDAKSRNGALGLIKEALEEAKRKVETQMQFLKD